MNKIAAILAAILFLGLSACHNKNHHEHEENRYFQITSPLRLDTSITQEYVCQIHAISHIEIRSQELGYLKEFYVDEGQFVKKGQILFEIMPQLYEADFHKSQAEAQLAEIEYQNTKILADSNVVSPMELAMAKAKLNKANAEVELAKTHLDFTKIRAPFDGIIDRFHLRLGSLVDEGELITHLSDNREMWVYFNVPEAEYLDYKSQVHKDSTTLVKLKMANGKVFDYEGVIETIEADFNNETGNIAFRATFKNPDDLLRHGETGNIQMIKSIPNALIIPQKASFEVLDKKYVYVLDNENRLQSRLIKVAEELPHIYVISEGLNEDDKILLEGLRMVKENQKIQVDFVDPTSAVENLNLYAE